MRDKFLKYSGLRYLLVGAVAYSIELLILLTLYLIFNLPLVLATTIAFWVSLVISFALQKHFAFKDYKRNIKSISSQFGRYGALTGFNYLFTILVVSLLPSGVLIISRTLALVTVTLWNYFIYKYLIFNQRANRQKSSKSSYAQLLSSLTRKRIRYGLLLSLPVILFFWQYLSSGSKLYGGDFDYYAQLYEAMRISVLKYHQFPLWNPWMSGGIPLFSNPQFGLLSIQSVLVIIFGTLWGMKLAFITYGLIGFWGMFTVGRRVFSADITRSALVGYLWVFGGFFAGHGIWHFTFSSFYVLPWIFYFIVKRRQKYSWLGLGISISIVILSSMHYAFLMLSFMVIILFISLIVDIKLSKNRASAMISLEWTDLLFFIRSAAVIIVLAGYQFVSTYRFVSNNERLIDASSEIAPSISILLKSLFLPIGTLIDSYPSTTWSWGEHTMYLGIGVPAALIACIVAWIRYSTSGRSAIERMPGWSSTRALIGASTIGVTGFLLALGDFTKYSPFSLLHYLPGFTQTRVPSRWQIFTVFALLALLLAYNKRGRKVINILLLLAVIELFISYGVMRPSSGWTEPPRADFQSTLHQYDNQKKHFGVNESDNFMTSYYHATRTNTGQIYADDSLVNTLSGFTPLPTNRCGFTSTPGCPLILTQNARVTYWSPNKIIVERSGPGDIILNMNVERGWRINGSYPYINEARINPLTNFNLSGDSNAYHLDYSPKGSPSWVKWKISNLIK